MSKLLGFKIWYSKSTFDSTQGTWKEAPTDDVQFVMFYFEEKDGLGRPMRRAMHGVDFYAMDDAGNLSQDFDDKSKVSGHIIYGKYMSYPKLETIVKEAYADYGEGWLWQKPPVEPVIDGESIGKP